MGQALLVLRVLLRFETLVNGHVWYYDSDYHDGIVVSQYNG